MDGTLPDVLNAAVDAMAELARLPDREIPVTDVMELYAKVLAARERLNEALATITAELNKRGWHPQIADFAMMPMLLGALIAEGVSIAPPPAPAGSH